MDFENATHVVALDKAEHRPLVRERFADWEPKIEYWDIADLGFVRPDVALAEIAAQIEALATRLGSCSVSDAPKRMNRPLCLSEPTRVSIRTEEQIAKSLQPGFPPNANKESSHTQKQKDRRRCDLSFRHQPTNGYRCMVDANRRWNSGVQPLP
jgi:hypothetical protein